jgi:hypothetical protein
VQFFAKAARRESEVREGCNGKKLVTHVAGETPVSFALAKYLLKALEMSRTMSDRDEAEPTRSGEGKGEDSALSRIVSTVFAFGAAGCQCMDQIAECAFRERSGVML